MKSRFSALTAALGLAAASTVAVGATVIGGAVTSTASAAGTCPNNDHTPNYMVRVTNNFTANGINIRTGDSTSCTSIGQGQMTHTTVLRCNTYNGSYNWNYLRDVNTDKIGWVRVDNLAYWIVNPC